MRISVELELLWYVYYWRPFCSNLTRICSLGRKWRCGACGQLCCFDVLVSKIVSLDIPYFKQTFRSTYRATLRRHGEWRRNLNMELLTPFTKNIAASWGKLFEMDLLLPFQGTVQSSIRHLLEDMEASAAPGLKERVKIQGDLCFAEAEVSLKQAVAVVGETVITQQKEVSRCLAPHVQNNLIDGYDLAMEEKGPGSVARQKVGLFVLEEVIGTECCLW